MFPCLRHHSIICSHDEYSAIHLWRSRYHILHIICMSWAISMSIFSDVAFISDMCDVYRDTTSFFLGRLYLNNDLIYWWKNNCYTYLVNLIIAYKSWLSRFWEHFGNGSGKRCFSVIYMTYCSHIQIGFILKRNEFLKKCLIGSVNQSNLHLGC